MCPFKSHLISRQITPVFVLIFCLFTFYNSCVKSSPTLPSSFTILVCFTISARVYFLTSRAIKIHFLPLKKGGRHSSVVLSAPTILRPRVWIPSTPSTLFLYLYYWNCNEKITKINKKRPGLAHFFKKKVSMFLCDSSRSARNAKICKNASSLILEIKRAAILNCFVSFKFSSF